MWNFWKALTQPHANSGNTTKTQSSFPGRLQSGATIAPQILPPEQRQSGDGHIVTPRYRRELRPDFPEIVHCVPSLGLTSHESLAKLIETVQGELKRDGMRLKDLERLNIAYQQKDPDLFPGHENKAEHEAISLKDLLAAQLPGRTKAAVDASIVETVHLNRSTHHSALHALTGRQIYNIRDDLGTAPLLADKNSTAVPYYIIIDRTIEQGTTMANMISFIEHQGGRVLAVAGAGTQYLAQRDLRDPHDDINLSRAFTTPARNTGRLAGMATILARENDWPEATTPQNCLEALDRALQRHGGSLYALTDGECQAIMETVGKVGSRNNFPNFIEQLHKRCPS